jgi:hypothetical protein
LHSGIKEERMSEHQYIGFRAADGPVSEEDLKYMRQQSSRAEITPWSFDNEYQFGGFHGDAAGMLRRGYDFHLHYANFGVRRLMIRFASGLPDPKAAAAYLIDDSLRFLKDRQGLGGILCIQPCYEPDHLDELWDLADLLDRLLPLRGEILDGDLRPLYLAHLAIGSDTYHDREEQREAPVPAGLSQLTDAQRALTEFYGLSDSLIAAAAQNSPSPPKRGEAASYYRAWLERQPESSKSAWLAQWMTDPRSPARREMLAAFQKSHALASWPTSRLDRTIAELEAAAAVIQQQMDRQAAEKANRARTKKLAAMAADPTKTIRATEKLVAHRSTHAYDEIATALADLREALAGSVNSGLAEKQAQKLRKDHPTLKLLVSELRRKGFLQK